MLKVGFYTIFVHSFFTPPFFFGGRHKVKQCTHPYLYTRVQTHTRTYTHKTHKYVHAEGTNITFEVLCILYATNHMLNHEMSSGTLRNLLPGTLEIIRVARVHR